MTDNEIIKALECCSTDVRENTCPKCIFYKEHRCSTLMLNAVSDLINRQKEEIETMQNAARAYETAYHRIKSEAIKEFVHRLKDRVVQKYEYTDIRIFEEIDNLVKEMTEVSE